jgi:FAD synthase
LARVTLALEPQRVLPCDGTYAGWADVVGERSVAMIVIGGPTTTGCAGATRTVEACLPDFRKPLFGKPVALTFIDRLCAEPSQPTADETVLQTARNLLAASEPEP